MGAGAYLEPLAVIVLLFGGAWINRAPDSFSSSRSPLTFSFEEDDTDVPDLPLARAVDGGADADVENLHISRSKRSLSPSLLPSQEDKWRERELKIPVLGYRRVIQTPNTAVFRHRLLSRILHKFPFLVEAWYWALIYWVYQLGRAFTAVTLVEGTVHVARRHALQVIELEQRLHIFWELPVQKFFLSYPHLMMCINWLYSFIHIPGTIAFLVWLYYYTITRNRLIQRRRAAAQSGENGSDVGPAGSPSGPWLYEARRRTMAVCNLLAFVVFTLWPCMPPRLLSDPEYDGPQAEIAKSFGFVDTVHGKEGASSVWTQNRFCNQYGESEILSYVPKDQSGNGRAGRQSVKKLCMLMDFLGPSGNALAALWLLSPDRRDHHDDPACSPALAALEDRPSSVLQQLPPQPCPSHPAAQHAADALPCSRVLVPLLHPDRHCRDREPFHPRRGCGLHRVLRGLEIQRCTPQPACG
ncbi:hypothetical protein CLAIMM_06861 isoform 1 [Cladophialophora immunda]|nr:hypothetical protein CLAIMM_06861 isoform 1 [Cladophialophora immunda]